jgi:hypothetical protein
MIGTTNLKPENNKVFGAERDLFHEAHHRIEILPVDGLTPSKANARTHSRKQIRQIADSIKRFGFNNPVLVDDAGGIAQ